MPPPTTRRAPPSRSTTVPVSRPLSGSAAPPEPELTLLGGTYTVVYTTVGGGTTVTVAGAGRTETVTGMTVVVGPVAAGELGELHESAAKTMPTSTRTPAIALPMMPPR